LHYFCCCKYIQWISRYQR